MPFVAVVTLIGTALTIAVLALYLLRLAMLLRQVGKRLSSVTEGLRSVVQKTEPLGAIVGEINDDLTQVDGRLSGMLGARPAHGQLPARSGTLGGLRRAAPRSAPPPDPAEQGVGVLAPPPVAWGVRNTPSMASLPQKFAAVAGVVYVGIGLLGFFVTGFDSMTENTGEAMFWLFHVTPFHNIVHIGTGGLWLMAAFLLTPPAAEGLNFAIAGVYVLAAILGYLGFLSFLGILPGADPDNFLHLVTGVVALLFAGLLGSRQSVREYALVK